LQEQNENDDDVLDFDIEADSIKPSIKSKKNLKPGFIVKVTPSIVDDQFFKLSQMEKFLEMEDAKEARKNKSKNDEEDESSSEDSVDYWDDIPSEDEDEEGSLDLENVSWRNSCHQRKDQACYCK
ncbi:U3 small nucleolar ribonucleoprotein protein MPP10-like, partial [Anneissia japonica]|uniref:U3 small nucleolar ribonucleoprotein protein MPP10-like n=1 Tax=Anneissia japonica TaxID=1529436 RepID=UPI0014259E34